MAFRVSSLLRCVPSGLLRMVRGLVVVGLLAPAPGIAHAVGAPPADVRISLSPTSGPAGTAVTVNGSGYVPGGYDGTLQWDGAATVTFPIPLGGSFSIGFTVPGGAAAGDHTITVCTTCLKDEFDQRGSAVFRVVVPPTLRPILPSTVMPIPRLLPPTPTEVPTACSALMLDPAARVIDFEADPGEELLADAYLGSHDVRFQNSLRRTDPVVRPRSGTWAGKSFETEFGSADNPIRMEFPDGLQALGMYVGMEAADETHGAVTALLQAYGYRDGRSELVLLGSGAATFSAASTPIQHCVSFTAAPGDIISRATLDYLNEAGLSIIEPRLVDDVSLLPTSLALPADQPPVVEILSPADGHVFTEGEVTLRAVIREDRALDSVSWHIDWPMGSTGAALAPEPGEAPGEYEVTLRRAVQDFLLPGMDNTLRMVALDDRGQRGEDSVTVQYEPPPELDLEIVDLEMTQATQCLGGSGCRVVPLIAGRPTLLRVYLRAAAGGPVAGVSGELCYWFGGETVGDCTRRVEPLWPVEATAESDPATAHRGDLRRTLNFLLPADAVQRSGTLYVQVRLNPDHDPEECCYENNELWPVWTILPEERLHVVFIPVDLWEARATLDQRWRVVDWLLRAYPVTHVQPYTVEGGAAMRLNPLDLGTFEFFGGNLWDVVLYELGWVNAWHDDPVDGLRYYGMVPDVAQPMTGGIGGMGYLSGYESAGIVPTTELEEGWAARYAPDYTAGSTSALMVAGHVAAEELGHNFGRLHATSACWAANADGGYPVAEGRLDDWGTDVRQVLACNAPGPAIIDGTGATTVDACNSALYNPAGAHDYMGYCDVLDRAWTSMYTYRAMIGAIGSAGLPGKGRALARATAAEAETSVVLIGAVMVTPDRLTPLGSFYQLPASEAPAMEMAEGPYRAVLLSAAGDRLEETAFGPVATSNREPGPSGMAYLRLPWQPAASSVAFEYEGMEIGRVTASARAPTVQVISPNGGETWKASGTKRIRWEAEDQDGDALQAAVQYSIDGGETWRAVAIDVEGDEVEVDLADLTGTETGMVRVTVTDGIHTSSDSSDATFTVEGKLPEVFLASPADGAEYPYGWPVLLEGFFTDREDGADLDGANAIWESDLDGPLGQGEWLLAKNLSPGRHQVSLSVHDSEGMTGTAEVSIVVLNPDGSAPPLPREIPWGWILGLGGAGLAGTGLLGYAGLDAWRSRRRIRRRG